MKIVDKSILKRYVSGNCTEQEKALVEEWFEQYVQNAELSDNELDKIVQSLDMRMRIKPIKTRAIRWYIAASIAAAVCIFGFIFLNRTQMINTKTISDQQEIWAPTTANAYILLKDNEEFNLDNLNINDTIATADFLITKLVDGSIKYLPTTPDQKETALYNTLITKAGGVASLTLSDGSKVWINANSKLTYPIVFRKGERDVALEGEGYFEIEKQMVNGNNVPFYVRGKEQSIQVLGTKFNINFYTKDTEIALLEGKIAVAAEGSALGDKNSLSYATTMSPNHFLKAGKITYDYDIERHIDWKEGYFNLNSVLLKDLARELSIWYGVEIEVENSLLYKEMFGTVSRSKSLNEVLKLLAKTTAISYNISENHIYISKLNN